MPSGHVAELDHDRGEQHHIGQHGNLHAHDDAEFGHDWNHDHGHDHGDDRDDRYHDAELSANGRVIRAQRPGQRAEESRRPSHRSDGNGRESTGRHHDQPDVDDR